MTHYKTIKLFSGVFLQMLRDDNWQSIHQQLKQFPEKTKETLQWKYWFARSLVETSQENAGEVLLAELATERHYYGFLAASRLSKNIALNHQPTRNNAARKKPNIAK